MGLTDIVGRLLGSPPLAWGILEEWEPIYKKQGITPTRMGNTDSDMYVACITGDHPHSHGEYQAVMNIGMNYVGSPPLAWGILQWVLEIILVS